ncbi:hypothetical protein RB195_022126 [Necator americanus]|uniref:Uncharacterized protein n=1 Tax=Necator americanus TaxID=51031 RepID=A0ABR1EF30_NECAM
MRVLADDESLGKSAARYGDADVEVDDRQRHCSKQKHMHKEETASMTEHYITQLISKVAMFVPKKLEKVFGPEPSVYSRKKETPYVMATISEIQRISNVLPWAIPHSTMNDVFINGYFIAKGTEIMPQYGCVLNDPNLFPNPDQFLPER